MTSQIKTAQPIFLETRPKIKPNGW